MVGRSAKAMDQNNGHHAEAGEPDFHPLSIPMEFNYFLNGHASSSVDLDPLQLIPPHPSTMSSAPHQLPEENSSTDQPELVSDSSLSNLDGGYFSEQLPGFDKTLQARSNVNQSMYDPTLQPVASSFHQALEAATFHQDLPEYLDQAAVPFVGSQNASTSSSRASKNSTRLSVERRMADEFLKEPPDPSKQRCPICNDLYNNYFTLKQHVVRYHRPPYRCFVCRKEYDKYALLKDHAKRRRHPQPQVVHRCVICDRVLSTATILTAHEQSHHKEKSFKCRHDGCYETLPALIDIKSHYDLSHPDECPHYCGYCDKLNQERKNGDDLQRSLAASSRSHASRSNVERGHENQSVSASLQYQWQRPSWFGSKPPAMVIDLTLEDNSSASDELSPADVQPHPGLNIKSRERYTVEENYNLPDVLTSDWEMSNESNSEDSINSNNKRPIFGSTQSCVKRSRTEENVGSRDATWHSSKSMGNHAWEMTNGSTAVNWTVPAAATLTSSVQTLNFSASMNGHSSVGGNNPKMRGHVCDFCFQEFADTWSLDLHKYSHFHPNNLQ